MSRTAVAFSVGLAVGAGLVYRALLAGLAAGREPDDRGVVSRTVPPQRPPLREEFHIPTSRTEVLPFR